MFLLLYVVVKQDKLGIKEALFISESVRLFCNCLESLPVFLVFLPGFGFSLPLWPLVSLRVLRVEFSSFLNSFVALEVEPNCGV